MWNSWAVTVPVAVKSAKVGEFVVPTPCIVPLPSSVDVLLENEELAVVNELPVASFRVTRVEKDELAAVNEPLTPTAVKLLISEAFEPSEPLTPAAVKVLISEALVPSEPLISAAICADELTTEPSASPSSDVNLDAKLLETVVNDPLTPAAVNVLINEAFDPNEPLISLAICADELTTEPSASPSSLVSLDAKLELKDVNEPLILTAS